MVELLNEWTVQIIQTYLKDPTIRRVILKRTNEILKYQSVPCDSSAELFISVLEQFDSEIEIDSCLEYWGKQFIDNNTR